MKLSVCIPVYNFDVRELVNSLRNEIVSSDLDSEIILIDDASKEEFITINQSLKEQTNQFIFLKKNIGRSAIRNLFLQYTSGEFLLFLDCDAKIISKNFLKNYILFIKENAETEVVFGGFEAEKSGELSLRKKYSLEREIVPLKKRKINPYSSFRGINFLVKREILVKLPFDENLKTYGYEDLIFSKTLEKNGVKISHIENSVIHSDEENTAVFLKKTDTAIQNLVRIYTENPAFVNEMKIIKTCIRINKLGLKTTYKTFFRVFKPFIIKKLQQINPDLKYFDLYKLGLFLEYHK